MRWRGWAVPSVEVSIFGLSISPVGYCSGGEPPWWSCFGVDAVGCGSRGMVLVWLGFSRLGVVFRLGFVAFSPPNSRWGCFPPFIRRWIPFVFYGGVFVEAFEEMILNDWDGMPL
ncbi:hypothetical protein QQ045_021706 [Rhodiola kirilowii]